jgi:hypothetical protein
VIVVTNVYDCKLCKCDTAQEIIVSECSYMWVKIVIKELTIRTASSVE